MASIDTHTANVVRRLEAEGWVCLGGAGHDKFRHPFLRGTIIVPRHRTLSPGVARSIHKAAGWLKEGV
jgi:predicted RNA binding protein YcfA (HicA-like mRNA interferase family)